METSLCQAPPSSTRTKLKHIYAHEVKHIYEHEVKHIYEHGIYVLHVPVYPRTKSVLRVRSSCKSSTQQKKDFAPCLPQKDFASCPMLQKGFVSFLPACRRETWLPSCPPQKDFASFLPAAERLACTFGLKGSNGLLITLSILCGIPSVHMLQTKHDSP